MQSLSRKYRPKTLTDVLGQPSVVQTLTNAIRSKRLHQGYLFVGQFGSGKTTVARILAAMENCTETPGLHPCGKCDVCSGIYEGRHVDIEEIDAASRAGKVDQIRELKKNALYLPVDGAKTKTFIIDECHRMSPEAEDALLKILEEPPKHVRFILCTTDIKKMRPAIQSRCQRHEFRKIYWTIMSDHLEKVAQSEKIECDKGSINLCAKLADGSMRNALENLSKLIDYVGGKPISVDDAQKLFGAVGEMLYYDMFDQVIGGEEKGADATEGFRVINKMLAGGAEFSTIYYGIADHLRNLMIGMSCSKAGEFIHLTEDGKRRLRDQLKRCQKRENSIMAISRSVSQLHDAKKSVDFNLSPEIALQNWLVQSIFAFRQ